MPSDVAVQVATQTVVVECKRPQSEGALERNVDDARHQLQNHYKSAKRPDCVGVIAVDLTKILNPNLDLLRGFPEAECATTSGPLQFHTHFGSHGYSRTLSRIVYSGSTRTFVR